MHRKTRYTEGDHLVLDTVFFNGYSPIGLYKVIKSFVFTDTLQEIYVNEIPKTCGASCTDLVNALVQKGYIIPVDSSRWGWENI